MRKLVQKRVLLGLATLTVICFVAAGLWDRDKHAVADDAYRVTGLSVSGSKLVASLNSTDPADERWEISIFLTPYGGSEDAYGGIETSRSDGITSSDTLATDYPLSQFASGDQVRAQFKCYDSGGIVTFSYSRTHTIL